MFFRLTQGVVAFTTNAVDNTATFKATNIGPNLSHIHYGTNGDWFVRSAANTGRVVLQDTGGNVGVGTAIPKAKLDVTGGNIIVGTPGQGIILKYPSGATCRILSISDDGGLVLTGIICP